MPYKRAYSVSSVVVSYLSFPFGKINNALFFIHLTSRRFFASIIMLLVATIDIDNIKLSQETRKISAL